MTGWAWEARLCAAGAVAAVAVTVAYVHSTRKSAEKNQRRQHEDGKEASEHAARVGAAGEKAAAPEKTLADVATKTLRQEPPSPLVDTPFHALPSVAVADSSCFEPTSPPGSRPRVPPQP